MEENENEVETVFMRGNLGLMLLSSTKTLQVPLGGAINPP